MRNAVVHAGVLLLVAAHLFLDSNPFAAALIGGLYLILYSWLGGRLVVVRGSALVRFISGLLMMSALLAGIGGIVYRLMNLSPLSSFLALTLSALVVILARLYSSQEPTSFAPSISQRPRTLAGLALAAIACAAALFLLQMLYSSGSEAAIRSPWTVLPPTFFAVLFVLELAVVAGLALPAGRPTSRLLWLWLGTGAALAVGIFVYRLGFGFDPYIHQATEELILQQGSVDPKPWYYLGQYGFVILVARLTLFPLGMIDQLLLPVAATLALPLIPFVALVRSGSSFRAAGLTAAALLALPLAPFVATTPQGIANVLLIAVCFLAIPAARQAGRDLQLIMLVLATTALITQPLAGVPALLITGIVFSLGAPKRIRTVCITVCAIVGMIALPMLFMLQSVARSAATSVSDVLPTPLEATPQKFIYAEQLYRFVLDGTYIYGLNMPLLVTLVAACGAWVLYRRGELTHAMPLIGTAVILIGNLTLLKFFVPFDYLIAYERGDYLSRLGIITLITLLPLAAVALAAFFEKLSTAHRSLLVFFVVIVSLLRTAGVYLSYPAFDGYRFDRGYSTSIHDIRAVRSIESDAAEPYVVLANQAVAAAAVRELGFKAYFPSRDGAREDIFFYPIPTGGPLYQLYLAMVYETPGRDTAERAMTLTGVRQTYFAVNRYWFQYEDIVAAAKESADAWWDIDGGELTIFRFNATGVSNAAMP